MTDSLTLSLLIFFAILVVMVLARELWRLRGLGRERVRSIPRAQVERARAATTPRRVVAREEPGFDSLDLPTAARVEPDFRLHEGGTNEGGTNVFGPADPERAPAGAAFHGSGPEFAENAAPAAQGKSVLEVSGLAPDRPQPSGKPGSAAQTLEAAEVSASTLSPFDNAGDSGPLRERPAAGVSRDPAAATRSASANEPVSAVGPLPAIEPASAVEPIQATGPLQTVEPPLAVEPVPAQLIPPIPTVDPVVVAGPMLSMTTDCIVELACATPIPGERLVSIAQGFRRCGTKPVIIEVPIPGATASSARQWRAPLAGDSCRAVRIGILLDNRSGPLNAMEFSEFLARLEETAERLGARYRPPQMSEVLLAARRLDTDCAQLDWNAGLNVDASELLGPGQLAALAGPLLITERGGNRYARLDEHGDAVFSVFLGDRPNRLTFLLDLPRVHHPQDAWKQMVECALVAARRLPGRLVDDGGKPLTERFLDSSAMQVHQRALALEAVGLKAGTAAARRVFN